MADVILFVKLEEFPKVSESNKNLKSEFLTTTCWSLLFLNSRTINSQS